MTIPTDQEMIYNRDEIIVSKTDPKGRIVYANSVFCRLAEMSTKQVLNQPHSIIRHPDMPRAVFKLLWDTISAGDEIFAYIKNMSASGGYYWVFAHVTPTLDAGGQILGYHSNRRYPEKGALDKVIPLYQELLQMEAAAGNRKQGLEQSYDYLINTVVGGKHAYDRFSWELAA